MPATKNSALAIQQRIYRTTRQRLNESGQLQEPFNELLPSLLDRNNLDAAWERVSSSEGARTPGEDGQTAADVARRVDRWLDSIASDIYQEKYQPRPPRWVEIPKSDGTTRKLGILTLRDRVVHAATKQVLEPILEPTFQHNSYGFRPGRSVAGAVLAACETLKGGRNEDLPLPWAMPADVANCFDSIDHQLLMDRLEGYVSDGPFLQLVHNLIAVGGVKHRSLWNQRIHGLIQGSGLSPLLCNFVLDDLDRRIVALHEQHVFAVHLFRYADDLLVLADSTSTLRKAQSVIKQTLSSLKLSLNAKKQQQIPVTSRVPWLGVEIVAQTPEWSSQIEFGYEIPGHKVLKMMTRIDEMTLPPSTKIDPEAFDLGRWLVSINSQLRDWWQAYLFAANAQLAFRAIDDHTDQRVGELLRAVTGKRWHELRDHYRVRLPRGFSSWQVNGCRLSVLSSLAPRRPDRLTRRPEWMKRSR